ncbi:zinc finger protein 816-like [Dreissena polymorpha]|uniref:C2H2-type domain-containing protein n=1 Tax=Dreissena polymorpha TaxID=45954 RepID=A0A9D4RGP4_DREPO|nr:zinc finger protein 816-like [Dreissena polymorpha]XP_052264460.1 zinc finger protein 816-like [Dreissena polymorpha]XP_052264461.1 zinc finger protein 816-like [Dreissena polymorpha]KAH3866833.1 hypothetical protein DPMN_029956 [Dreissena polymorpha]
MALLGSLNDDVQNRIIDLFSVFEALEIHAALMVVKKSVMYEVQNCGTSAGKKFLLLNPDVGSNFLNFCASSYTAKRKDQETIVSSSLVEDCSNDTLCSGFELSDLETPAQGYIPQPDPDRTVSLFDTEKKMSADNLSNLKIEQESEPFKDLNSINMEDISHSEVSETQTAQRKKPAYPCPMKDCIQTFSTRFSVRRHVVRRHEARPCETCKETFPCRVSLDVHKDECHGKGSSSKVYDCEVCHQKCRGKFSLMTHKLRKHAPKHLTCNLCGKGFASAYFLRNHKKMSHFDKSKKCTKCDEKFTSKASFATHMKKHETMNVKKVFNCQYCDEVFELSLELRKHRRRTHYKAKHQCQVCGKCYVEKNALGRHELSHNESKSKVTYKCRYCEKILKSEYILRDHENGHTKEKKFVCDMCGTEFYNSSSLGHHRKRHIYGSAAFKKSKARCVFCQMLFDRTFTLARHLIAQHLDEALASKSPYVKQCGVCTKVFPADKLQRHISTHYDAKDHKCLVCSKAFVDKGNAYQHMVRVHKMEKYPCLVCKRVFWTSADLDHHCQMEHAQ